MKKSNTNSKKGFTIIEVVLVLAIAGLIFLMVFVALPNLQRTQRDTQRRDDVARLSTALTQYITNNNSLPLAVDSSSTFYKNYLNADGEDTFEDPNGSTYNITLVDGDSGLTDTNNAVTLAEAGDIAVVAKAKCGSEGAYDKATGNRKFAVIAKLEGSGYYCADNN